MTQEALKLALEALEGYVNVVVSVNDPYEWTPKVADAGEPARKAITAIKEALAQPEQEPVAWITESGKGWLRWHNKDDAEFNKTSIPLYKHPKRKPLSDSEIALISAECSLRTPSDIYFARAIEAAHGIKE